MNGVTTRTGMTKRHGVAVCRRSELPRRPIGSRSPRSGDGRVCRQNRSSAPRHRNSTWSSQRREVDSYMEDVYEALAQGGTAYKLPSPWHNIPCDPSFFCLPNDKTALLADLQ